MDWKYLFTSLEGRINRKPFWIGLLVLMLVSIPLQFLGLAVGGETLGSIISLLFVYPGFALNVKRAHDRNRPDWIIAAFYALLIAIIAMQFLDLDMEGTDPTTPFILAGALFMIGSIWLIIDLGFLRGTPGPNDYGPDPLEGQA